MTLQSDLKEAAKELENAALLQKSAQESIKELKKALKENLDNNPDYQELTTREKKLKHTKKEITEELQLIKKEKEQIAMDTEEQKELDDFLEKQESSFEKVKEKVVQQLSRKLADEGIAAEIHCKKKELILVVARF